MTIPNRFPPARRSGFTLVELLVAAAVSVIIMAILATAFQSGIDTMRQMRSTAGLQDQLRAATEMIRRDLKGNHFVGRELADPTGVQISGAKLSGQWLNRQNWVPPVGGFFHIESSSAWTFNYPTGEGQDPDGLVSTRSNNPTATTGFLLHFTSILAGDSPATTYSANTSVGAPSSPAAEVAYFLDYTQPTGSTGPLNLYRLVRRQRLIALTGVESAGDFAGISNADQGVIALMPGTTTVCTLANMTNPANRLGGTGFLRTTINPPNPAFDTHLSVMGSNAHVGDDVLLSNVISFTVQVNWDGGKSAPHSINNGNSDDPFDFLNHNSVNGREYMFDTGYTSLPGQPSGAPVWPSVLPNGHNPPPVLPPTANQQPKAYPAGFPIRIKSLQIRLRIYDPQLKSTRQVTIVQDM